MQLTLKWSKINIHWKELHGFDHDKEIQGESIERQGAFQKSKLAFGPWPNQSNSGFFHESFSLCEKNYLLRTYYLG